MKQIEARTIGTELTQNEALLRSTVTALQQQLNSNAERLLKTEQQLQQQGETTEQLMSRVETISNEWKGLRAELRQSEDNIVTRLAEMFNRGHSVTAPRLGPNG
jgi:predicted nuclease with TOPRIM domain